MDRTIRICALVTVRRADSIETFQVSMAFKVWRCVRARLNSFVRLNHSNPFQPLRSSGFLVQDLIHNTRFFLQDSDSQLRHRPLSLQGKVEQARRHRPPSPENPQFSTRTRRRCCVVILNIIIMQFKLRAADGRQRLSSCKLWRRPEEVGLCSPCKVLFEPLVRACVAALPLHDSEYFELGNPFGPCRKVRVEPNSGKIYRACAAYMARAYSQLMKYVILLSLPP